MGLGKENEPWSVILDVVFLDFLDVVVGLGVVHSFGTGGGCVSRIFGCCSIERMGLTISKRNREASKVVEVRQP